MKVHGADISNYYNVIKQLAIETDYPFEGVAAFPNQESEYLGISPMGKIPAAETEHGAIAETRAIVNYMANTSSSGLYPESAWDKARVEELMSIADLYIEGPARRHLAEAFFKGPRDEAAHNEVRPAVEKGLAAFQRRAALKPYLLGEQYSVADIYVFHCLYLARQLMQATYNWDILEDVDGLSAWYNTMAEKDSTRKVMADQAAAMKALMG